MKKYITSAQYLRERWALRIGGAYIDFFILSKLALGVFLPLILLHLLRVANQDHIKQP